MGSAHALSTVGARQGASGAGTGIAACAALSADSRCCGENASLSSADTPCVECAQRAPSTSRIGE
jgi:hypothetical protein